MNQATVTRRGFLGGVGAVSMGAALSACGFGVGQQQQSEGGGSPATLWDIAVGEEQKLVNEIVRRFDRAHDGMSLGAQFFQNDPYKNKLRVALGSGNPPDIFYGWGGGVLESQVAAGKVRPLGNEVDTGKFLASLMEPVTVDGTVYGIPNSGAQPALFYYNTEIFDRHGLQPPETWAETLDLVETLKGEGVTPISLAGKNKWPGLIYEEYLVDRIGGAEPFQRVVRQEAEAWSDPAFLEANRMIQELVEVRAFPDGFTSIDYDTGEATQLVYTGEAAMHLMGSWDYGRYVSDAPEFLQAGKLGWFAFPEVDGGNGDPATVAGNPSTYYSITEASESTDIALAFFNDTLMSDYHVEKLIGLGQVPPVKGIREQLRSAERAEWLTFVYEMVEKAPHFVQSWDQKLPPKQGEELLTNLDLVFLREISPEEFSARMNETIGG